MPSPALPRHLVVYATAEGKEPLVTWLAGLDASVSRRIRSRIDRMSLGNFSDHKGVGEGVEELRTHFGSGYRVYYAQDGNTIVVLLCGGDKRSQRQDIRLAQAYWRDYQQQKESEK